MDNCPLWPNFQAESPLFCQGLVKKRQTLSQEGSTPAPLPNMIRCKGTNSMPVSTLNAQDGIDHQQHGDRAGGSPQLPGSRAASGSTPSKLLGIQGI